MQKTSLLILALIFIFGFLIRFIGLGSFPKGFTPDEASQAYTAYSLLKTGKDEWGVSWPITSFKSFLDYKSPLQTYLMIPSVAAFGLNEFAARLPSALLGSMAIVVAYFLANQLFADSYKVETLLSKFKVNVGHLASFVMAISPWHIQFSRMALEANLLSFLFPIGLYFFLIGLKSRQFFLWTAIFWGLSFYSYHAAKVFLPLFIVFLFGFYWHKLDIKNIIFPGVIFLLIISPQVFATITGKASARGSDLLVFNINGEQQKEIHQAISYALYRSPNYILEKTIHNNLFYGIDKFIENYISYLSPTYWFTEGGKETTYSIIPGRGLLYFWQLPFILYAIYLITRFGIKNSTIIWIWLFLASLPAAITKEGYRPNRASAYAMLPEILTSYGVWWFLTKKFNTKKIISSFVLLVVTTSSIIYFEDYFSASSTKYPLAMSYGWREVVSLIKPIENSYDFVRIERGNQAQSFISFYLPVNPKDFQQQTKEWSEQINKKSDIMYLDQLERYNLGKFIFGKMNWPEDINDRTLYISPPSALLPANRRTLQKVTSANSEAFEIFDFPNL